MVYGAHDPRRRENFILRRVRAGRRRIPIGAGTFLWSRGWVEDIAAAVRLAAESAAVAGIILNVCERHTWTVEQWARQILDAAGSNAELVRVPDDALPEDLWITSAPSQHLLLDASRARCLLHWVDSDPEEALAASIRWHLDHPPADDDPDFSADDRALSMARTERASIGRVGEDVRSSKSPSESEWGDRQWRLPMEQCGT